MILHRAYSGRILPDGEDRVNREFCPLEKAFARSWTHPPSPRLRTDSDERRQGISEQETEATEKKALFSLFPGLPPWRRQAGSLALRWPVATESPYGVTSIVLSNLVSADEGPTISCTLSFSTVHAFAAVFQ